MPLRRLELLLPQVVIAAGEVGEEAEEEDDEETV